MKPSSHNLLLSRAFQYLGIIVIVVGVGGGYWYWKGAHAGVNLQSSQEGTLSNGLVGYWSFDGNDISGTTAYDRSGQGNNGAITNGPANTIGQVGQALLFNGTNQYITTSLQLSATDATQPYSMSAWVKTSVLNGIIIQQYGGGANRFIFGISGHKLQWIKDGGTYTINSTRSVDDGVWHLVTGVKSGSGAGQTKLYVDGVLDASGTDPAVFNAAYYVNIGGPGASGPYFNGSIDEPRIYNRALSASEIWDLYQMGASDKVNSADSQVDSLNKGLAGYWKFDDGSGTSATDSSGNGNTSTLVNSPSWTTGQIGGALSFNGTNQRAYVPSVSALNFASGVPFSVSAWIKTSQTVPGGNNLRFINKFTNSPSYKGYIMQIDANQKAVFYTKDGTTVNQVSSTSTINDGAWHHIIAVRDILSGLLRLYVDGVQQSSTSITNGDLSVSSNLNLGVELLLADNVYLNGSLDEVRVYNRALSADEVAKLYKTTAPNNPDAGLVGYWSFNSTDIVGTTAYDRSGKGNNGTLTNGPTKAIGKVGQALSFDGGDDFIAISDIAFGGTNPISICAWMKPNTLDSRGILTQGTEVVLRTSSTGHLEWILNGFSTNDRAISSQVLVVNDWSLVCGTYVSGGDIVAYINGIEDGRVTPTGGYTDVSNTFVIGDCVSCGENFNGAIDEVRIYNRALSAGEIWDLYQLGNPDHVNAADSQGDSLEKGLVGYWKLDDASGTSAADASGNGNTGTLTNGPTWTTGRIGGATDFDGTNDYIEVPSNTRYDSSVGTWSFWARTDTSGVTTADSILFRASSGGSYNGVNINVNPSSRFGFQIKNGGAIAAQGNDSSVVANDGSWHHVALVWTQANGGTNQLFVDGRLSVSISNSVAWNFSGQPLRFADASDAYWEIFDGSLDEVRIYNRALSADEVAKLYKTTAPDNPDTGLVGYWSFNGTDISGTTAYDRSGSGNNGTLTNGPTKAIGRVGQGMNFDGVDDYITAPDANSLDIVDAQNFTISGWFNRSSFTTDDTMVAKSNGQTASDTGYDVYIDDSTDKVIVTANDGTDQYKLESVSTFTAVGWHHFVLSWDDNSSTNTKLYIDGNAEAATATGTFSSVNSLANALTFRIGAESDNGNPFDGSLDEVRIYNRVLSQAEVAALYNAGR